MVAILVVSKAVEICQQTSIEVHTKDNEHSYIVIDWLAYPLVFIYILEYKNTTSGAQYESNVNICFSINVSQVILVNFNKCRESINTEMHDRKGRVERIFQIIIETISINGRTIRFPGGGGVLCDKLCFPLFLHNQLVFSKEPKTSFKNTLKLEKVDEIKVEIGKINIAFYR